MSALTFKLKTKPDQRVDMSPLVCQLLTDKSIDEIRAIELQCGKALITVDELFYLSGSDVQNIIIENSFEKLDCIAKGLDGGNMTIRGNAGAYLAQEMQSGRVLVEGNTDMFTACEMKQGQLMIEGNVGDFLGGALIGNKQGMKGGTVIVKGNAGDRVGDHMRRGTILIEGNVGDYCGSRMTAGTIAVMGTTGGFLGYAMRRGTLLLWQQPVLLATFKDCGLHSLSFLFLLFNSFKRYDSKFANTKIAFNRVQRYSGDVSEIGRGEILVKA
ncbi:MAG: formylmethanofuran dehydrogenase subunit C [Methylococcales bacterium]|nr:formylmethanofuran dehydrogenase subunit C [Methylococcales bacterium]